MFLNLKSILLQLFFHSVFVTPVKEDRHIQMLLGVLLCFRHVMPHLATQEVKELGLKGSFGVTKKEEEGGVTSEQLQQVSLEVKLN